MVRPLAVRLLSVAIGIVTALAIGEIALRAFAAAEDQGPQQRWLTDRKEPHLRNRVYSPAKRPGTFRILAIGDSFTWGHAVAAADAYPDRLQRLLDELYPDRNYEVVNWSHPGWNTFEEWRSVKGRLAELEPDLVILGFVLNDPEPTNREQRTRLHDSLRREPPSNPLGRFLDSYSLLARRLLQTADNPKMRQRLTGYYRGLFEGPGWDDCRRALRRLDSQARKAGAPLAVVIFPIFDSQFDQRYAYFDIHEILANACSRLRLRCLDLLSSYRQLDTRTLAVDSFIDPHPNELAHEIAAGAILEYLLKERLPSGDR